MGKKTTAGVNGSPSRTITVRSSNEASSAPVKLRPSGASARIIPQNFSLGLERVAITKAPGPNIWVGCAESPVAPLLDFLGMRRFSLAEACIANRTASGIETRDISWAPRDLQYEYAGRICQIATQLRSSNARTSPT